MTDETAPPTADDRLIVALDVADALTGLKLAERLGDTVSFYKIGLGMLAGGGLALANELKAEHGKRIFLDMKLFDIGATVEAAVRGLVPFEMDFLTVHGDPNVVTAARTGASGGNTKILAVTILTSLEQADLAADADEAGRGPRHRRRTRRPRARGRRRRGDLLARRSRGDPRTARRPRDG